jgi:hypothetical protein
LLAITAYVGAPRFGLLEDVVMLSVNTAAPGAALAPQLLSAREATLFQGLKDRLPDGWMIAFEADAEMAWLALVYCAEAPRSEPLFTICRWTDRLGLLVQWMNGAACSASVFEELDPVMGSVLSTIFTFAETHQATVRPGAWADTRH